MMGVMKLLFPANNAFELKEQIHEILKNLREQIPLLYVAVIVNIIGLHIAIGATEFAPLSPVTFLLGVLIWRALYWSFFHKGAESLEKAQSDLLKVTFFSLSLCLGFSIWAQMLINRYPELLLNIAFFNVLAALGAAYGLSSFPRAAFLPLTILGLPIAARLLLHDDVVIRALGLSLVVALLLFMRFLHSQKRMLTGLIGSRMIAAREHNRAISAEVAALKRADEDALTGLANRAKLLREMEKHMVQGPAAGGGSVVAICDLDGFKRANDIFGHAAGDALLMAFGERLTNAFDGEALVARMGGDEFAVFWRHGLSREALIAAGTQICELARQPFDWMGKKLTVATSCGFTESGPHSATIQEFLRQADTALYMAKGSGRGQWKLYDEHAFLMDKRRSKLETLLLSGDIISELTLQYQPIYCTRTNAILHVESLARWRNIELGDVRPSEFIPLAESIGNIETINDALLEKALIDFKEWDQDVRLSFNLSARQISRTGAAARLLDIVRMHGALPQQILFEVTESAVLSDLEIAKKELDDLRKAGCLVALDDFGAGHASVSYLRELVFDVVKLDASLTKKIQTCPRSRQLLLGLVNLCHAAETLCVAEHIETEGQLALVSAMGCDMAQGFYLSRPLEPGQLRDIYTKRGSLS